MRDVLKFSVKAPGRRLLRGAALTLALCAGPAGAELRDGFSIAYQSPPAPQLRLPDTGGVARALADYRGQVVVINFWASWCPPCIEEMPAMQRMWEVLNPQGLEVLAVNVGQDREHVVEFVDDLETALEFPILLDRKGRAYEGWGVRGLPKTFVVDKTGHIIYTAEGGRQMDSEHILGLLRELLAE